LLSLACLSCLFCSGPVSVADDPNRPVRWLIGFSAGGPVDIVARIMSQWLSEHFPPALARDLPPPKPLGEGGSPIG
jgi:tripartite-type tricarboxylate transporter receptor subunit TctC